MLKFFLVAHLTYENQWVKLRNKKNIFGFFGTPYCTDKRDQRLPKMFEFFFQMRLGHEHQVRGEQSQHLLWGEPLCVEVISRDGLGFPIFDSAVLALGSTIVES